jgi:hypothetical protein
MPKSGDKMSGLRLRIRCNFILAAFTFFNVLLLSAHVANSQGESVTSSHSLQDTIALGERMYRDGILPSGEPMMAYVKGDLPVSGTAFSCVSCHLRGGLGSVEGGVITPPTNGERIFKPAQFNYKNIQQKFFPLPPRRSAYTDISLAEVIRSGENPAGVALNDVMPRYLLENSDMAILISYLKYLSKEFSTGVTDKTIHFATVITEDVPLNAREAMLAPLQRYIDSKNNHAEFYESPRGSRSRLMVENMLASRELATRRLTLTQWVLKGPADTWRSQLDEYYRKDPVFALLGGITTQDWQIIHQFSEENKIPCLLPQSDLPNISDNDWYTLYPSKGYYQEGEAAARYLNSRKDITVDSPIVQIVRESAAGKALSAGFEVTWQGLEHRKPVTFRFKNGEQITETFIERLLAEEKPAAVLLWDGPDVRSVLNIISNVKKHPELVLVSSRYLGNNFRTLPEEARSLTYITYPFSFAQKTITSSMGKSTLEDESVMSKKLIDVPDHSSPEKAAQLSDSITQLMTMALMDMRGNYYRDNFFDVISMVPDQPSPLYGRLSFGPGQRYASKGCYIVQVTKGPDPELVRKSEWVIH